MFYGWIVVGTLWALIVVATAGSGIAWGFYAKNIIEDLGLTAADIGAVSGLAVVTYSVGSPIAGYLIVRYGSRAVMTVGCLMSALGCCLIASGTQLWQFFIGFSFLLSGGGVLYAMLPSQTLITNWFNQYRARVLAVFSTSTAVGGFVWLQLHNEILQTLDWRAGWWIAAALQCGLALAMALLIRNRPEDLGLEPDGLSERTTQIEAFPSPPTNKSAPATPTPPTAAIWAAIRTPQFVLLVLLSVAAVAPNSLVMIHGRLHLETLGLSTNEAVSVLSISALIGIVGRLSSAVGDFISPVLVLLLAFGLQALGTAGLIFADTQWIAYASVAAMGIGFGAGWQTIVIIMGRFFGREIFSATQGARTAAAGVFNATIPWAVGLSADVTGGYTLALSVEAGVLLSLVILSAFLLRSPKAQTPDQTPNQTERSTP